LKLLSKLEPKTFSPIQRPCTKPFSIAARKGTLIQKLIIPLLIEGETVEHAYKLLRDLIVFTNKRLILVGKQGITGKKQEILSIPYGRIVKFSKENAGRMDFDAEIKVWVQGATTPLEFALFHPTL
jgi:Bacterial PH domain